MVVEFHSLSPLLGGISDKKIAARLRRSSSLGKIQVSEGQGSLGKTRWGIDLNANHCFLVHFFDRNRVKIGRPGGAKQPDTKDRLACFHRNSDQSAGRLPSPCTAIGA